MIPSELRIMIMSGPDDGRVFAVPAPPVDRLAEGWTVTFGRREECDVSIPFDTQVSRLHATLQVSPEGSLTLTDSGSLNGTFVDNVRIETPTPVRRSQLFRLGRTWMRVEPEGGADER